MSSSKLIDLKLAEAVNLIAKKEISPVDLVEASLSRIEEVNPHLNAYISLYEVEARQVAKASEMMLMAGHQLGPLHGIPIALKDNIALKGLRTTAGSKILGDWIPEEDATVASRLKSAGAIIIGKNILHEFAWGGSPVNPHYGTTKNPINDRFTTYGSSGGSGVAVASKTVFGALGTDTGGSVRLPSSVMGLVGIRPTIGRVSNYNVIPLAWSMDTVGPMTCSVEDCAIMLGVIAGYDHRDEATSAVPVTDYTRALNKGVKGLRIGIEPNYFFDNIHPDNVDAVKTALLNLEKMGAIIIEIPIQDIEYNITAQVIVEACEPSAYHQGWLRERAADYGEDVRTLLELGELYTATQYIQAQRYRTYLKQQFKDAFQQVDVFISPMSASIATRVDNEEEKATAEVEANFSGIMYFTGIPSLTGLPAINIPCGTDRNGMPIGMQIIGKHFDEWTLFRVGAAYEAEHTWNYSMIR